MTVFAHIAVIAGLGLATAALAASDRAAPPTPMPAQTPWEAQGQALVTRSCGGCHAVGRTGDSPKRGAPAFRTLSQRYPVETLGEPLAEGLMTGHPEMPEFVFEPDEVHAILAYLESIQVQAP